MAPSAIRCWVPVALLCGVWTAGCGVADAPCEGEACDDASEDADTGAAAVRSCPEADRALCDALEGADAGCVEGAAVRCSVVDGCPVADREDCALDGLRCADAEQGPECVDLVAASCIGATEALEVCAGTDLVGCTPDGQGAVDAVISPCFPEVCDADRAACEPACPEAVQVLSCADSGRIFTGYTSGGSTVYDEVSCGEFEAPEAIFQFAVAADTRVLFRLDGDADVLDLYAIEAWNTGCGGDTTTCRVSDTSGGTTDEITLDARAMRTYYVVIDGEAADDTGYFSLDVLCLDPICGDGVAVFGEGCDDGGQSDGDGCSASCEVEAGWSCFDAPSNCTPDVCGDGTVNLFTEQCDDGNSTSGDGCDADCTPPFGARCTFQEEPQECFPPIEMGELAPGQAIGALAGGPVEAGVWDAWTLTFTDHVLLSGTITSDEGLSFYLFHPVTGSPLFSTGDFADELVPAGEYAAFVFPADFTSGLAAYSVSLSSVAGPSCGDGVLDGDAEEGCDDGNRVAGDGCDAYCQAEFGWLCDGSVEPTPCERLDELGRFAPSIPVPALRADLQDGGSAGVVFDITQDVDLVLASDATSPPVSVRISRPDGVLSALGDVEAGESWLRYLPAGRHQLVVTDDTPGGTDPDSLVLTIRTQVRPP